MIRTMLKRSLAVAVVGAVILTMPAQSQAICHWFGGGGCSTCGTTANRPYTAAYAPYTAAYAPYVAAYPAAPCSTCNTANYSPCQTCASPCQTTCNYMPQTCYRTVYQQVPVTSYMPVAGCDACGNQTTAYRPVTSYVTQPRLVPYTSYRPVYAPMVSYAPAVASPCATGGCSSGVSYAAPAATYSAPAAAAPSCCGSASTTPSYSTPTVSSPSYVTPAPNYSSAPSSSLGAPGSSVPSLAPQNGASNASPLNTYRNDSSVTEPESRLKPIPDTQKQDSAGEPSNKKTNSTLTPRLLNTDDRTTMRPAPRAAAVIPVSAEQELDNEGWRPARR